MYSLHYFEVIAQERLREAEAQASRNRLAKAQRSGRHLDTSRRSWRAAAGRRLVLVGTRLQFGGVARPPRAT